MKASDLAPGAMFGEYSGPDGSDPVNPSHYKYTAIEAIDYMKAISSPEEFQGYLWLTAVKYLHRWQKKGGVVDIEKAQWFLDRLVQECGQ